MIKTIDGLIHQKKDGSAPFLTLAASARQREEKAIAAEILAMVFTSFQYQAISF